MDDIYLNYNRFDSYLTDVKTNAIDPLVIERIYHLQIASTVMGDRGEPFIPQTLFDARLCLLNDFEQSLNARKIQCEIGGVDFKSQLFEGLYLIKSLFKGLNKKLRCPIIITEIPNKPKNIIYSYPYCLPSVFVDDDNIISFNPKNLSKYLGYQEKESRLFHKNFIQFQEFFKGYTNIKYKMIKPSDTIYYRNVHCFETYERIYYMWAFSCDKYKQNEYKEDNKNNNLSSLIKNLDHDIPIPYLNFWKKIARDYYNREYHNNWDELTVPRQKRIIVNTIRHNSIGYNKSFYNLLKENKNDYHDMFFKMILIKIKRQFEYLASECINQLDYRNIR